MQQGEREMNYKIHHTGLNAYEGKWKCFMRGFFRSVGGKNQT